MEILACIKQVPDTSEIKIDPVTNTLIRKGVPSIVNPFDLNAVETAIQLKEANPGSRVTLLTMGPPAATDALRQCLAMGCDRAYLLTDRAFAGADTYATSYALAVAASHIGHFDVFICGMQAVDGDTGQVGPEIAEHLDLPQVTYVTGVESKEGALVCKRQQEDGYEVVECPTPCLITVTKAVNTPRNSTVRGKIESKRASIDILSADALGDRLDRSKIGLKGSPTKVKSAAPPKLRGRGDDITGKTAADSVSNLMQRLIEQKFI